MKKPLRGKKLRLPEISAVELLSSRLDRNPSDDDEKVKPSIECLAGYIDHDDHIFAFCNFIISKATEGKDPHIKFAAFYIFVVSELNKGLDDFDDICRYACRTVVWEKFNDLFQAVTSQVNVNMPRLPPLTDENIKLQESATPDRT